MRDTTSPPETISVHFTLQRIHLQHEQFLCCRAHKQARSITWHFLSHLSSESLSLNSQKKV